MSIEIAMLFWAAVLGLAHVGLQGIAYISQKGFFYTINTSDDRQPSSGSVARIERALRNYSETFPIFAAVVLAVHVMDRSSLWSEVGAQIYFWGRLAYVPAYVSGLPWVRTIIWLIATSGILLCMVPLFDPALLTILME